MSTAQDTMQNHFLYLFDRPGEPFFIPKGTRRGTFAAPSADYLVDRFRHMANELTTRYGVDNVDRVTIQNICVPDLSIPLQLGRQDHFSHFIPQHRRMASRLIQILMEIDSYDDFLSLCVYSRDRINPYMWMYAVSVAVIHRPDTRGIQIPPLCEIFPDKFVDGEVFLRARETVNIITQDRREPLVILQNFTASDLEDEHRVAYFREDVGVNLHHWHWHLVYPNDAPRAVVDKDRRGELFYYMHQQIMARYNFERLCNLLGRTKPILNFRVPIVEGYFSKLNTTNASRVWPPRQAYSKMEDVYRESMRLRYDIHDMERWRDRIIESILTGRVVNEQGQVIQLNEAQGIDILGNLVENSILSINRGLYGDLHNAGHVVIGLIHDPDGRHLETFGVIGDTATSMRDPAFYRWHAFIDDIFQKHKELLPPYTLSQLDYQGVRITSLEIVSMGGNTNEFNTFWQQRDVDLSHGMDFAPQGPVFARLIQLQHVPFLFRIQVENTNNSQRTGTVRIFLAPRFDENGDSMLFRDQRHLFIELDKFQVTLRSNPVLNIVEQESVMSNVTIPFEQTFRNLETRPAGQTQDDAIFCGCGWPNNLLIPKGNAEGYPCQLFAMISNIEDDRVEDASPAPGSCVDSSSYCGLRNRRYPDRRSMGYPFDRLPRDGAETLQQFLTRNMAVTDVNIFFTNRVEPPATASPPATVSRPGTASN